MQTRPRKIDINDVTDVNDSSEEEDESWKSPAIESPSSSSSSSWAMHSCSSNENKNEMESVKITNQKQHDSDNQSNSILLCLKNLQAQGVLYQGVTPIISTIFISQFIFFFLHAYTKRSIQRIVSSPVSSSSSSSSSSLATSPLTSLLSSCSAGICNVLLTNPLWVTNMAIVSGGTKTQNLLQEIIVLYKRHGMAYLWKGSTASMMLVSNPIIQFVCYEQLKRVLLASSSRQDRKNPSAGTLGPAEAFILAAFAKAVATVSTYPLQLSQTLLRINRNNNDTIRHHKNGEKINNGCQQQQYQKKNHDDHQQQQQQPQRRPRQQYKGTLDCLIQLYNDTGIQSLFTGMRAKLLQTVLTAAFTFLSYEQIVRVIQRVWMIRQQPQQRQRVKI